MQSSRLTTQLLELSIVGSSCTVHQDERKYLEIEQGLHLIPWTGNTSLLVDRYDARTFLDDQSKFGLKSSFPFKPTQEEIEFELMCDKERYLELNTELSEVQIGTEEEEKRALESFAQIPYNYEPSQGIQTKSEVVGTGNSGETVTNENTDSNIFTPSLALKIPPNMATPDNEKMHAIIVKTASHVAEKGNQLEIIIKTKQQFNSSFDFLNLEDTLNPYYKHVKSLILSGAFKPLGGSQQGVNERMAPEYPTPPPHSDPSQGYPGGNPPQNVTVPNIPQGIPGNQTERTQENKDLTAESNSSSGGEMELHPLLRYSSTSGSSSKFKPIPVKAKRRQKAKLFLERIKKETKTESADFAREMDNDDTGELPADVYITPPPPDLQQLIDQVAYQVVSSTSESFERHLKEGGNSIYDFLYPSNQYNAYYRVRKGMLMKNENIPQRKVLEQGKSELVPISFSFQKKMNNKDLGQKVYLGEDSSSGGEDEKINQSRTHEYDNDHDNGSKSECIQTTRRKRVAEFMQKIKDKKSKKVGKLKLKPKKVSGATELYHPEFPTDEPAERKVYHQPPVQYEVQKTEQSRESDWRTVSSLSNQDTLTDVISAKIRHK